MGQRGRRLDVAPAGLSLSSIARGMTVPDVIAPGLRVLFVGVNPGIRSGQTRHHFAHPSGRLWKVLYESGFTPQIVKPAEEQLLLEYGLGLTNLVDRPTSAASELAAAELRTGAARLRRMIRRYQPEWIAILGVVAYRIAFGQPDAVVGPQARKISSSRLWVLPGPTGRNAHYPMSRLTEEFRQFYLAIALAPVSARAKQG